jgi:hypothetical protein
MKDELDASCNIAHLRLKDEIRVVGGDVVD